MPHRFKVGDCVVYMRPHEHDSEDDGRQEVFVGTGAVGVVTYVHQGVYQYQVEYRYGPIVVRQHPLDRQLDPAASSPPHLDPCPTCL